ncbi:MAG TPA: hypothetical protein VFC63_03100 [Blastocatellia bacterium]|nr:hypothetical protein [Blastocatellia bacterium]
MNRTLLWPGILSLTMIVAFLSAASSQDRSAYIALRKTENGRLVVYQGKDLDFTIELKGKDFDPVNTMFQMFLNVDNRLVQIYAVPVNDFADAATAKSGDHRLLEKYRDWEIDYLSKQFGQAVNATSEQVSLTKDHEALLWKFAMPAVASKNSGAPLAINDMTFKHLILFGSPLGGQRDDSVKRQLVLTTVSKGHVVYINSALREGDDEAAAKKYLIDSLLTLSTLSTAQSGSVSANSYLVYGLTFLAVAVVAVAVFTVSKRKRQVDRSETNPQA